MKLCEKDELLIQRCVDGELSAANTRILLQKLDSIDSGWKVLACGLLEDRALRSFSKSPDAFRLPAATTGPAGALNSAETPKPSRSQIARHWWSHPVTSLTLCAAIAFVGGMLIPDFRNGSATSSFANNDGVRSTQPMAASASTARGPYQVGFSQNGNNSTIPVYTTIDDLKRNHPSHPLNPDYVGHRQSYEWIVVPVGSDRSMLLPVSGQQLAPLQ